MRGAPPAWKANTPGQAQVARAHKTFDVVGEDLVVGIFVEGHPLSGVL